MSNFQNLDRLVKIVDSEGRPTDYFIRMLQDRGGDQEDLGATTSALAIAVATLNSRQIIAGTALVGGGTLAADVTIDHADSAVTPGSYTNADITVDEQGHVTAAANGSSGGGGWTKVLDWDFAVHGAVTNIVSSDLSGYNELMVCFTNVTTSASTWRNVDFSADGGSTWLSGTNWSTASGTGVTNPPVTGGDSLWFPHSTSASAARTCNGLIWGLATNSPKPFHSARDNLGMWYETQPINRARARTNNLSATFTGGIIEFWAR